MISFIPTSFCTIDSRVTCVGGNCIRDSFVKTTSGSSFSVSSELILVNLTRILTRFSRPTQTFANIKFQTFYGVHCSHLSNFLNFFLRSVDAVLNIFNTRKNCRIIQHFLHKVADFLINFLDSKFRIPNFIEIRSLQRFIEPA